MVGAGVISVLAHPDDAEIWAGGTLSLHARRGDRVLCCVLAGGEGDARGEEAAAGAAVLGASLVLLEQPDRRIRASPDLAGRVSALFREFQPAVVITHWEQDSHPDHVAAHDVTRRAIVQTSGLSRGLRRVLACDTYLGRGRAGLFQPDVVVDVTAVWDTKLEAIRAHRSQEPEHYVAAIERQCWLHGARAGVGYAEGFRTIPTYGRTGPAIESLV